jgi:hypothetical protein
MAREIAEKYQLAGLDEHERGFNRVVELERADGMCRAVLRYETTLLATNDCATPADALIELIRLLHLRGFQQLRSQLSFREKVYFGSREPWIEYPDPARSVRSCGTVLDRLFGWLRKEGPRA